MSCGRPGDNNVSSGWFCHVSAPEGFSLPSYVRVQVVSWAAFFSSKCTAKHVRPLNAVTGVAAAQRTEWLNHCVVLGGYQWSRDIPLGSKLRGEYDAFFGPTSQYSTSPWFFLTFYECLLGISCASEEVHQFASIVRNYSCHLHRHN